MADEDRQEDQAVVNGQQRGDDGNPAAVGDGVQAEGLRVLEGQMAARFEDMADNMDATSHRIDGMEDRLAQLVRAVGRMERRLGTQEQGGGTESEVSFDGKSNLNTFSNSKRDWVKFGLSYTGKPSDEDFDSFCLRFETCCNLNDVPKESFTMLLGVYVKDLAATYLRETIKEMGTDASYSVVKAMMKKRLTASHGAEQVALEVSTIKQRSDETVRKYYERFRKLVSQGEDSELSPFVLLHFRQGLKPKIRESVMALAGKSLPELLQAATSVEAGLAVTAEEPAIVAASDNSGGNRVPPQNNRFFRQRDPHAKRLCYRCGSDKHLSYNCEGSGHSNGGSNTRTGGRGRGGGGRGGYQQRANNIQYAEAQAIPKQQNGRSDFNGDLPQARDSQQSQYSYMQSMLAYPWMQPPPWMQWYGQFPNQPPAASFASSNTNEQSASKKAEKPEQVDNCTVFCSTAFEVVEDEVASVESEPEVDCVMVFAECDLQQCTNTISLFTQNQLSDSSVGADCVETIAKELKVEGRAIKQVALGTPTPTQTQETRGEIPTSKLTLGNQRMPQGELIKRPSTKPPDCWHVNGRTFSHLLLSVLCLFTVVTPCASQAPMICRTGHTIAKFKIPDPPPCSLPNAENVHEPYDLTFTLYKPNLVQYKSEAYHCRIVKTVIVTHSGFFGTGQTRTDDYIDQQVSRDICYSMFKWHTSPHGDLVQVGTLYQTNNVAEPKFRTGFHCCKDYEFTVLNSYLYQTVVLKRHGREEKVESPAGVAGHCAYPSGFCTLKDGSALLWEPDNKEQCQYLPHQQFEGKLQDLFWMSNSGELALSFTKQKIMNQAPECGGEVMVSDQGIACNRVQNLSRLKREADKLDGEVTDSEVNAKLQALELRINQNYNHLFKTSFLTYCQNMQSLAQLITSTLERNPTLAARHLLNHTYIHAKLTHNLLSVYPCEKVDIYTVLPADTCSNRIPLNAIIAGSNQSIWLDTHTNIVYHNPELGDCSLEQEIPVSLDGQLYYYHHKTGELTKISELDSINLVFLNYSGFAVEPDKIVIHELLLYDWNVFKDKFSLNDWTGSVSHQSRIFKHLGATSGFHQNPQKQAETFASNVVNTGIFSFLSDLGELSVKQLWIFLCCVAVTANVFWSCLRMCTGARNFKQRPQKYIRDYFLGPGADKPTNEKNTNISISLTQKAVNENVNSANTPLEETNLDVLESQVASSKSIEPEPAELAEANSSVTETLPAVTYNKPRHAGNWPSRVTADTYTARAVRIARSPASKPAGSWRRSKHAYTLRQKPPTLGDILCAFTKVVHESLVKAIIANREMDVLIDTGAQVSTISKSLCDELGLTCKIRQTARSIRAVSGDIVKGIGDVYAPIRCADIELVEARLLVIATCHYPLILGVDNLRHMGRLCIDFSTGRLHLLPLPLSKKARKRLPTINANADSNEASENRFCNVFANRDLVFPPMSDSIFCVPSPKFDTQTLFEPTFVSPLLLFASTLSKADGYVKCRVINTSHQYVQVFKETPLGIASELPKKRMAEVNVQEIMSDINEKLVDPIANIDMSKSALSKSDQRKFIDFLKTKRTVFAKHDYDLGKVGGVSGRLCDTGNAAPIRKAPYRIPVAYKQPVDEEISKMLKAGIIEPDNRSAWASPILMVKKKNSDKLRLCTDFRKINSVTTTLTYPLPHQDSVKEMLAGQGLFTTLDLVKAYWQIKLDYEEDQERSVFVTHSGTYKYKVIPFGWKNSPIQFQRAISTILDKLNWQTCQCFIDDILIFSPMDVDEHIKRVGAVLDRFIEHGLKIHPKKSTWARSEAQYLGHVYDKNGSRPTGELVDKIKRFPSPTDLPSLRRALGLVNYYRGYIANFSEIAKPLLELLKKDKPYTWSPQCESAFKLLKTKLAEYPVLRYPDFSKRFILQTDSSGFALGAQLLQEFEDGNLHPVGFHSRVLTRAETNYSTIEREGLSILDSMAKFRHLLLGHKVIVMTDHAPLKWLMTCDHKSSRLAKYSLKLQEYDLQVIYKPGKSNVVADALSRVTLYDNNVVGVTETHLSANKTDLLAFARGQREDNFWAQIIDYIMTGKRPIYMNPTQWRHWQHQKDKYFLQEGVLYYCPPDAMRPLLCVPESLQFDLITTYHSSLFGCHTGRSRTYKRLSLKYHWLGMSHSVAEFVAGCIPCNQRKRAPVNAIYPLKPLTCERPFSRVSMDVLGPLPLTPKGNKYIVGFQCSFTKVTIARPIPDKTAESIAEQFVEFVILPHGTPNVILSDNGKEFASQIMEKLAEILRIDKRTISPFCAQTNGEIERWFSTFSNLMSTIVNRTQTDWDYLTKFVLHSYNNTEHSSTGFSPNYLLYGRDLDLPFDLCVPITMPRSCSDDKDFIQTMTESLAHAWAVARDNIESAQREYKYYHDLHVKGPTYALGDIVYILVPRVALGQVKKFSKQYHGPYVVTKLRGLNVYIRALGTSGIPVGVEFVTHMRRLKRCKPPMTNDFQTPTYVSVKRGTDSETRTSTDTQITTANSTDKPSHSYNLRRRH